MRAEKSQIQSFNDGQLTLQVARLPALAASANILSISEMGDGFRKTRVVPRSATPLLDAKL